MASTLGGYAGKVLKIDLTNQEISEYPWSDEDRALYLGGKIMAAKILYDNIRAGTDGFAPENMLVVSTGPLSGTAAPASSRFNISSISPLTGLCASSNCGGNFGLHLKRAGYDALVMTGKSETPVWIEITEDAVRFHDAASLMGKTTSETQEALEGKAGKLVIGPAGEHLVRYAGVFSEERTAGRAGMGAVMGSKNLKAITATGTRKMVPHDAERMKKVYKAWIALLKSHPLTGEALPKYGSAFLLRRMNRHNVLATRNFKYGKFEDFDMISGQTMAEKHLIKNIGCVTCPIHCGRQVEVNGKKVKGPELETVGLLGSNLMNNNLKQILEFNYQLDELGMDTMTAGGTIAFAMELQEKGLWDCGLHFGQTDTLPQVFEDIAYRRGIGDLLAEGTKRLAEKFGGKEFAINVKGLELAAYEPRGAVGQGLGYATANRGGCHLNAGYLVLMEGLGLHMNPYTTGAKAALAILNQNLMEAISAAGCCLFPLFSFYPAWLVSHYDHPIAKFAFATLPFSGGIVNLLNKLPGKLLPLQMPGLPYPKALAAVTGMKMNVGRMKEIGERGYTLERLLNIRMGLTGEDDTLPKRLTDELQIENDPRTRVPLQKMKRTYYKIRGWDSTGVPSDRKKKALGLQ
ncbi:MAG TPA: aldehyde ferredoxin oxidoreductase family protein [Candidatus Hydrogenedentes bacterium]|nr:aldehyde ferredoxin oxidoreductase family protein [Candidatus Hydrogenedentota bacterium]HOC70289.1 aldehyde ferredoxin oxidoreductase family protein [Candidatus Hydrogenedentota bacterium]